MRDVLKLPAYRRLLSAYVLNELAWSIGSVALALLVYRGTGSALGAMAFYLCAQFLPAFCSPFLVARLDQRAAARTLPALYLLEAVLFAILAWLASNFSLAPVLVLALADGIVALTARALARTATVSITSSHDLLREGNAITNGAFSICYMVGPAIGAAIVATGGTGAALLTNGGLFALMALVLATATSLPLAAIEREPTAGRLRAALRHVNERPSLRALLSLQAVAIAFFTVAMPVEVVLASHTLHAGAGGFGALLSAWGAGAVAGSAIYARFRRWPGRALIALGAGALGVGFIVMAAAPSLVAATIGAAVAGAGNGVEAIAAHTELQEMVQRRWLALTMGLNESLTQAMPGVGIVVGGLLAQLFGPRAALAVAGAGALAVTAAVWVVLRPELRRADAAEDAVGL